MRAFYFSNAGQNLRLQNNNNKTKIKKLNKNKIIIKNK